MKTQIMSKHHTLFQDQERSLDHTFHKPAMTLLQKIVEIFRFDEKGASNSVNKAPVTVRRIPYQIWCQRESMLESKIVEMHTLRAMEGLLDKFLELEYKNLLSCSMDRLHLHNLDTYCFSIREQVKKEKYQCLNKCQARGSLPCQLIHSSSSAKPSNLQPTTTHNNYNGYLSNSSSTEDLSSSISSYFTVRKVTRWKELLLMHDMHTLHAELSDKLGMTPIQLFEFRYPLEESDSWFNNRHINRGVGQLYEMCAHVEDLYRSVGGAGDDPGFGSNPSILSHYGVRWFLVAIQGNSNVWRPFPARNDQGQGTAHGSGAVGGAQSTEQVINITKRELLCCVSFNADGSAARVSGIVCTDKNFHWI